MKEKKWRNLFGLGLTIMLGFLAIMVSSHHASAQKEGYHLLPTEEDFSGIGTVSTVIPPAKATKQQDSTPSAGLLSGWVESGATTLVVQSKLNELDFAIVSVSSYKFETLEIAQEQLKKVDKLLPENGIHLSNNAIPLDKESIALLNDQATSWLIRWGSDDENMQAYFLWIQLDTYVWETYVATELHGALFGQEILQHMIQQAFKKEVGAIEWESLAETNSQQVYSNAPTAWVVTNANETLERSGIHFLAVWNLGGGNNQHYIGAGGDALTCSSGHGCIGTWTWWMNGMNQPSKLGIPKSFLSFYSARWNGSNYQATVWCC